MSDDREKHRKLVERRLRRLAVDWPDDLWMFAADGGIYVMERGSNGEHVMTKVGGVDPNYQVCFVSLPIDGGDW